MLGTAVPKFEHVQQLDYISRVLKETLRLWPTAPAFAVYSKDPETIIGGKYKVTKDETLMVLTPMLHRDPKVWEDPEKFDPDRFIFENFQKLPPHSWKPFGNGQRACIGRPFALQEATLVLGMLLRRFDIKMADPEYKLDVMETLTMKPHGLFIHAIRRDTVVNSALPSESTAKPAESATKATPATTAPPVASTPIRVAYGSNAGSAEAFARKIASDASKFGYSASIGTMDSLVADGSVHLAQGGPLVVVTASYEGKPPDNARKFVEHLENLQDGSLEGLKFAVFGVGNPDWARTYQAIPKLVDAALERVGGTRIVARGEADARGDFYGDFDSWYSTFWAKVDSAVGKNQTEPKAIQNKTIEIEFVKPVRDPLLRQNGLATGTIVENRELVDMTSKLGRSKRHVEIELPEGMTYRYVNQSSICYSTVLIFLFD